MDRVLQYQVQAHSHVHQTYDVPNTKPRKASLDNLQSTSTPSPPNRPKTVKMFVHRNIESGDNSDRSSESILRINLQHPCPICGGRHGARKYWCFLRMSTVQHWHSTQLLELCINCLVSHPAKQKKISRSP